MDYTKFVAAFKHYDRSKEQPSNLNIIRNKLDAEKERSEHGFFCFVPKPRLVVGLILIAYICLKGFI